jgi:UDP-2,3-diacylglucosamine hydrolase
MIYFISDLHLGLELREKDIEKENLFLRFLEKASKDCEQLMIVGDLFDYWFEYKTVIPKYFYRSLAKFHEMTSNGIKIEYIMGNHDFGHLDFFEKELNIPVIKTDKEYEFYGSRFFISHGDGKSNKDLGYKILKKILRSPLSLWLYLKLHPNVGISLASNSSKSSRKYTSTKRYGITDGMRDYAFRKIEEEEYDYVVMGHRHIAEKTKHQNGYYINLGEWIKKPTFGQFDGKDFKLINVSEFLNS